MYTVFCCPSCGATMRTTVNNVGKKSSCPKCNQRLQVPPVNARKTVLGVSMPIPPPRNNVIPTSLKVIVLGIGTMCLLGCLIGALGLAVKHSWSKIPTIALTKESRDKQLVLDYLRTKVDDPTELEIAEWYETKPWQDGKSMVLHAKIRSRNRMGGKSAETMLFCLRDGKITSHAVFERGYPKDILYQLASNRLR